MLAARAYNSKRIWGPPRAKIWTQSGLTIARKVSNGPTRALDSQRGSILHEREGDSHRVALGRDGGNGRSGDTCRPSRDADQRPARPGDGPDDGAPRGRPPVRSIP